MYYNIEVINDPDIEFIDIAVTRTESQNCKGTGIFVLNSNPCSYFFPGCAEQAQTDFEIRFKSNLPSKQTDESYNITRLESYVYVTMT